MPNDGPTQLSYSRDDQVWDRDAVVQWARTGEQSLDVDGPLESRSIAGQLVQSVELNRDRVVIASGLGAK